METNFLSLPIIIIVFLTVVLLHITKRNSSAVLLYLIQSVAVTILLINPLFSSFTFLGLVVALAALGVKAIIAPLFLSRLIKKYQATFSAPNYLNFPLTLIMVTIITALTHSSFFSHLSSIEPANKSLLSIAIATVLISFFLIINRKGAISQIIGILSLENGIVAFAVFAGLEQTPALQLGIIFDLFVWVTIATVFISMMHKQFGTLDVTTMKNLKD